jgi:hypothetical protein
LPSPAEHGIALRNATQRNPEMAKISRTEGGVACITLPGEAYRLRVPEERPQQSLGLRLYGAPRFSSAAFCKPTALTRLPAELVTSADVSIHLTVQTPARCFGRRSRVSSMYKHCRTETPLSQPHHQIVATFRPGLNSLRTDGRRARNCRQKLST